MVDNVLENMDIDINKPLSSKFNIKMDKTTKPMRESKIDSRVIQKIKEAIKTKGWKPVRLAREFGYSDAWISNIMKGKRSLDINTLIKIAEILDVEPASLLPGTNPEKRTEFEDYLWNVIKERLDKYLEMKFK